MLNNFWIDFNYTRYFLFICVTLLDACECKGADNRIVYPTYYRFCKRGNKNSSKSLEFDNDYVTSWSSDFNSSNNFGQPCRRLSSEGFQSRVEATLARAS